MNLLADEENINGTQIKFVEKGQRSEAVFASVHTSVELEKRRISVYSLPLLSLSFFFSIPLLFCPYIVGYDMIVPPHYSHQDRKT